MVHTFAVYVDNKPGVLNRVASLFRRRAFNIESLTVGRTEQPGVSRMTVGLAEIVNRCDAGPYRGIRFTSDQMKEIRYAALLHDFGINLPPQFVAGPFEPVHLPPHASVEKPIH